MGRADKMAKIIRGFTLAELEDLRFAIEEQIERLREESTDTSDTEAAERKITIREEWKTCGKVSCQCITEGKLHGPYVYHYWKEGGRTHSRYIGKVESKQRKKSKR